MTSASQVTGKTDAGSAKKTAGQSVLDSVFESMLHIKPRQNFLTTAQVQALHEATLSVMERTGLKVTHKKAKEIIKGLQEDGKIVF